MGQNTPTLSDVAARAGVGVTAVSAALRGCRQGARVSEETRKRIMQAAAELRYTPNMIARGLRNQRHNTLGVTFQSQNPNWITSDYYGISVLTGIIEGAYKAGYSTNLFHKRWQDADRSAAGFRGQAIDGFLVVAPVRDSDMVSGLAALGIPLVVISSSCDEHNVSSVDVDNARGVRLAMKHLLELGHRRIALITELVEQFDIATRRDTFLTVLAEAGMPVPPDYVQVVRTGTTGYEDTCRLLQLPLPPTAVFTTNDRLAISTMRTASDMGIRVPEQLSIVGFDDHPNAERASPALTTLRQPLTGMAEEAARLLIGLIEGEDVPVKTHWFEPELIVRGSTARRED